MALQIALPFVVGFVMEFYWRRLEEPQIKQVWGAIYEHLDLRKGRAVMWVPVGYLLRRLLLSFCVVYQVNLCWQYWAIYVAVLANMILVGWLKPRKTRAHNLLDLTNEFIIMLIVYCFLLFSDMILEPETKFAVGTVCCWIGFFHLAANIVLILYINATEVQWVTKKKRLVKLQKQRVAEFREKRREAQEKR